MEDEAGLYPTKDSPALDHKSLKSVLSNSSKLSKSPDQHRHHHLSTPSHHSIYFQLGSDQSDENSDDNDDDDGDLGSELLGFGHEEEGHDNENNHIRHINTNLP